MKKALSLVSSAVLALAVAIPAPAATQLAKKATGATSSRASVELKAQQAPAESKMMRVASRRTSSAPGAGMPSLRKAMNMTQLSSTTAPRRAAAASADLPDIYGLVTYQDGWSNSYSAPGYYKLNADGTNTPVIEGAEGRSGVAVDGIYYTSDYVSFFGMVFVTITGYDIQTGERVCVYDGDVDDIFFDLAYDPSTGGVFGIGFNAAGDGLQLSSVEFTESAVTTTAIAPLAGNWNSIACTADGQLYAISYEGSTVGEDFVVSSSALNKIDRTTGAVTPVGPTGQLPQYLSSAAIDARTGRMYWTVNPPDETGLLCEVNLATGQASTIYQFELNDEVQGLFIPAPEADDKAPAAVTGLAVDFPNGSLSGTVKFTAPNTLYDGTAATGSLTYEVMANGTVCATGSTTCGAAVSAPATLTAAGEYTFVVTVSNAAGKGPKTKIKSFVGNGVPAAPKATLVYEGGKMKLTWTPVTTSADGGYIDASAVKYTVTRYPGEIKVANSIAGTSYEEDMAETGSLSQFYYTVVASCAGLESAPGVSNTVTLGSIALPYSNDFSTADALEGFTIIDVNDDGKKWKIDTSKGAACMGYNSTLAMDDWLITPPLRLEAGETYLVSFVLFGNSTTYKEKIEVKWGAEATVAGLDKTLLEPTIVACTQNNGAITVNKTITPAAAGVYYVGFHGMSEADQYNLYVDNLLITSASVPAAATDLTVTPGADGALQATVAFKAPAVDLSGKDLTSLSKVELFRDGTLVNTFSNPAPGAALTFTDSNIAATGTYSYTVKAHNASGAGIEAEASVFVGINRPAAPEGVTMVETATLGQVTVAWQPVSTDIDGNAINPAKVTYMVAANNGSGWQPFTDALTVTSHTFMALDDPEDQDFVQYAVFAVTEGGNSGTVTPMIPVGKPYDGLQESFADGNLTYGWATGFSQSGGAWSIYSDTQFQDIASADTDGGFAGMKGEYLNSAASLMSGKISLAGTTNPGITFSTYSIAADDINEVQLYVKEPNDADWTALGQPIVVNSLGEDGWFPATASLVAYAGKTIQVRFEAVTKQYQFTFIDAITVGDLLAHDLTARDITAPATVNAGADYTAQVTVANSGVQDATAFTVELYADGKLAATKSADALAAGQKLALSFDLNMSAIATEPVELYAKVVYTPDEKTDNNTSKTLTVTPRQSRLPAVTDLKAEDTAAGVALTWSEPDLDGAPAEPALVDFEDAGSFDQSYEGWTFVDKDGLAVGGFQNNSGQTIPLPGITVGQSTLSFFVFDTEDASFKDNPSYAAHSGTKYLASLFLYGGENCDDWAISPMLDGSAQTISFWAKSYSSSYPETIQMLYSTGSLDTASFVKVDEKKSLAAEWTLYTFDVPAGAKYFAIRSYDTNAFMLMLDDFTFVAAGSSAADLSIVGYDIYRDGVKLNTEPVAEAEYTDATAEAGSHTYHVITVYDAGISAPSNAATVATSGLTDAMASAITVAAGHGTITVTGAEGQLLTIAAADGRLITAGTATASVTVQTAPGVYIVRAGAKTVKVAVK